MGVQKREGCCLHWFPGGRTSWVLQECAGFEMEKRKIKGRLWNQCEPGRHAAGSENMYVKCDVM